MNDVFRHLHVSPALVCEFLGVFSRVEYALKVTGHVQNNNGDARANWDTFANSISDGFEGIEDDDFKGAVEYLSERPPSKQVISGADCQARDNFPVGGWAVAASRHNGAR